MKKLSKRSLYLLIGFAVPFLNLLNPAWISIKGVGPSWAVLWLLPWALEEGSWHGMFAGFCIGMLVDATHLEGASQIPALIILGFWWGRLGRQSQLIESSFNLGLLAWIGAFLIGLTIWVQKIYLLENKTISFFHAFSLHSLLAETIITALLAPIICSLLLLYFFRYKT
ncbi:rod shape-determining protein MreD [Prochlorococcus marinus]|uniref:Uncharacterized protein n=1 Tax=Prochlorococcus marinus (strain MIT 9211) TaxID=93059 RepID=A9BD64_PROM4|nr:rod shape-determining protein MreD [Prochlorococcus marinus]ABX09677.1 conserved hypothetical protein [Prochlorococcus marinus str. MIT 9211]